DGTRVRRPGGLVGIDRTVRVAQRVVADEFGAVHVAADQHVLIPDRAPLHDADDVLNTHYVDDSAYVYVYVYVGVRIGFGVRVRIDLFVRADEHVLVRIYVGDHARVPAVVRPVVGAAGLTMAAFRLRRHAIARARRVRGWERACPCAR